MAEDKIRIADLPEITDVSGEDYLIVERPGIGEGTYRATIEDIYEGGGIDELKQRVSQLENAVSEINISIANLRSTIVNLQNQIGTINNAVSSLNHDVASIETRLNSVEAVTDISLTT